MKRLPTKVILGLFALAALASCLNADPADRMAISGTSRQTVAQERAKALRRGLNLSHWYAQSLTGQYDEGHLSTYLTQADIDLIASMGFDHVRLTLSDRALFDAQNPGALNREALARFDERLSALLGAGLNVVIDLHPEDNFKKALHTPGNEATFIANWSALAAHLAKSRDPGHVFLEILNEPGGSWPAADWAAFQTRVHAAVRSAAPAFTLIANAGKWSGAKELAQLVPLDDTNIIYTFHWYEPMLFTHQGAKWGWQVCKKVSGLPFPVDPADSEKVALTVASDEEAAKFLRWGIAHKQLTAGWIEEQMESIAEWQKRNGDAPVWVGEFGVFTQNAPPDSRYRWIEACRGEFERRGWGWAVWDYKGGFRVVSTTVDNTRNPEASANKEGTPATDTNQQKLIADPAMIKALGLEGNSRPQRTASLPSPHNSP